MVSEVAATMVVVPLKGGKANLSILNLRLLGSRICAFSVPLFWVHRGYSEFKHFPGKFC